LRSTLDPAQLPPALSLPPGHPHTRPQPCSVLWSGRPKYACGA
jgi:hypothetical protein